MHDAMSTPTLNHGRRRALATLVGTGGLMLGTPWRAAAASQGDWSALKDGSIVLFRHANAPGVGDPPGFKLGECRTQRNLDDTGRAQARRIGEQFRQRGIRVGAVLTSQWCRTRETAELAFPGQVREDPNFNSFFGDRSSEPAQTAAALATLTRWRGPGVLVVVTHQVNISALTDTGTGSSEGVVVQPADKGLKVLTRLLP
jgi:phosphohistidine phosphatase SixA